jgi:YHS domain-containing protein
MIRFILLFILFFVLYYVIKRALDALFKGPAQDEKDGKLPGDEMVLDPECNTYVVKQRAITRRINGKLCSFCSEACAEQYERKHRS